MAEKQQQHKRLRCKPAATPGKQEGTIRDPQAVHWAGSQKTSSQVFHAAVENECQDIAAEPAPTKMEEETTNSLHASIVGALATIESSVPTDW
jgi:hypothetical protein